MTNPPLQLEIRTPSANDSAETVRCEQLLREVPDKRWVYAGTWNQRDVIVKVFAGAVKGRMHAEQEWRGLNELQERAIDAAEGLIYGSVEGLGWALVMSRLMDVRSAIDVFNEARDERQRQELVERMCRELGRHHEKGMLQKDLHLGNFLLGDDKVYVLDAGQMEFTNGAVDTGRSISQLALMACSLYSKGVRRFRDLFEAYCAGRGWQIDEKLFERFSAEILVQKKRQIQHALRKCMRTNKRHLKVHSEQGEGIFARSFIDGADAGELVRDVDAMMDAGDVIKRGNTCYVSRIRWNGFDVAVKRYNHKGMIHSLRHTVKRSRARRCWLGANRLEMIGVATAHPLGYFERLKGPVVWESYLLCEYVEGRNLDKFLGDKTVEADQRGAVLARIRAMFERMDEQMVSHTDLKPSNIIICGGEPVLIDLDAMEVGGLRTVHEVIFARSMKKFAERADRLGLGPQVGELVGKWTNTGQ